MVEITVNADPTFELVAGIAQRLANPSPAVQAFYAYMRQQTDLMFVIAGAGPNGGSYRGVTWEAYSPNYHVQPSGARVTATTRMGRDTGNMANEAGNLHDITAGAGNAELRMWTTEGYMRRFQEGDAATGLPPRPYLFFQIPEDRDTFVSLLNDYALGQSATKLRALPVAAIRAQKSAYLRTLRS